MSLISSPTMELAKRHRSIRRYLSRPVEDKVICEILEAAQSSSTSSNLQAYSIIQVQDKVKREKIAVLANHQQHIIEAPVFLVFCADLYRLKMAGDMEGLGFDTDYFESFLVSTVDVALMAQTFMLCAESLGLGGVFIGGIRNNLADMISLLKLPKLTYPVFGMCLGYPNPEHISDIKPRFHTESILHTDCYSREKVEEQINQYDRVMEPYFLNRNSNNKSMKWSQQISQQFHKPRRTDIRAVIEQQQEFGLK